MLSEKRRRRPTAIGIALSVSATIVLVHILQSDAGLRAAYPGGIWNAVSTGWRAPVELLALAGATLRAVARVPLVQVRVLLDHPTALTPIVGASFLLLAAWRLDTRATSSSRADRWLDWAAGAWGLATLIWFLQATSGQWGSSRDWDKDWIYLSALKEAIQNRTLPYYIGTSLQGTERYLANLETLWAPHVVLLALTSINTFFVIHLGVCFALGHIALLQLRRELGLTRFWWVLIVVVFVLNGNITSHLGAGHTQWAAYFLLPCVFVSVARLDDDRSNTHAVTLALWLTAMIAIGGWHVFVWSILFVVAACAPYASRWRFLAVLSSTVAAVAAFRLVPAMLTFGGGSNQFAYSYANLGQFVASLIGGTLPADAHEYDTFVGWFGFVLVVLGALQPLAALRRLSNLWLPSVAMIALSMFDTYRHTLFNVPGFVSERVVTRMAIVGVFGLLVIGSVMLSQLTRDRTRVSAIGVLWLLAGCFLTVQLGVHAEGARPSLRPLDFVAVAGVLKPMPVEPVYWWSVWASSVASLVASVAAARLSWKRSPAAAGARSERH